MNGATGAVLRLVDAQPSQAGAYRVLVSNAGGTTISDEVAVSIINPADLFHLSPLWSKPPAAVVNVTNFATSFGGASTPNERNIAYNPTLNQLYVQQRDGNSSTRFAVHVVDAATGTWLHTLKTNGIFLDVPIFGGNRGIAINGIGVGADGAIYACNTTGDSCGCANPNGVFRVYRWADSDPNTVPVQVFQGEPTAQSVSLRWGDVMSVRGSSIATEILLDNHNATARHLAILRPVDETMTTFTAQPYSQVLSEIPGTSIGRSLQHDADNTFWQKRKAAALVHSRIEAGSTFLTATYTNFPAAIGQVAVDLGHNVILGINHAPANATVPDTLDLYDFSEPDLPLLLAQYNFPVTHQNNANFIGHVLVSGDKVFALSANNGILAFRIVSGPQSPPTLLAQPQNARVIEGNAVALSVITADLATFQWQLNSNNIPGATAAAYNIPSATAADAGAYRVIVSNDAGSVTSSVASVTVLPATDFARLAPLWSLAPLSRPYLRTNSNPQGQTPLYRGIAYNALSNQVYLVTRTGQTSGLAVNVLDASTGEDLYQLNTTGILGGTIILLGMDVADDGAIYAANMADFPNDPNAVYNMYRWANSDPTTVPVQVYSGDPGMGVADRVRWGDTLDVRGAGMNTEIVVDANSATAAAIFRPVDETMNGFVPTAFTQTALSGSIGRSLQFADGNSFWQKRKGARLQLSTFDLSVPSSAIVSNFANFPASLGPVTLDSSRNLLAGIEFASSTNAPDTIALYDASDLDSPLLIARYNFPTNQQPNANFIGQVLFGGNRVWAVDGNNGVTAFSIVPPSGPPLAIELSGAEVLISWDAGAPDFVLQKSLTLVPANWVNVSTTPDIQNGRKIVTESASSTTQFYRLCQGCP